MRTRRWSSPLLPFAAAALFACGGDAASPNPPPPPVAVASVEVSPTTGSPVVSQTVQLTATPRTAAGNVVAGKTVTWSTSAEVVASVSTGGAVTAVTPGQATITATVDGVSGSAGITVLPGQAASCTECLEVVPGTLLLSGVGAGQRLAAFLVDAAGRRTLVDASFESSNPGVVAVTPVGQASAVGGVGSSQLLARFGNVISAPVIALVAQPVPGALLVSDNQIEGAPSPVDPAALYQPGYRYRVRLRGVTPAVGQVVLGTGASPVGGRVISNADAGGGRSDVVLELLPLTGMFAAVSINQQVSLGQAPSIVSAQVADAFSVEREPGGNLRFTPRRGHARMVPQNVRPLLALNDVAFDLGPFECKGKVEGALSFPLILNGVSFTLNPNLTLDLLITNGQLQRLVAHGGITPTLASNLLLNAAVKGSLECKVQIRTLILPIGGPIALIIGGQVPLGVGFAIEAKAEAAGIGYDAFFQATVTAAFGLDCASGCQVVHDLTNSAGGFFKPVLPASFNDLRTEVAASLFGYAELQIGNPFLNQLQFKAVEIKAGLQQKAELASEKGQADDVAYASNFQLAPTIEAKTTSDVAALGQLLNIQFAELSFAPTLPTLASSPAGTFTITPATVQAGNASQLGDMATFTVTLNPVSYLGTYAVDGVEIRWLKDNGSGTLVLQPGRPGCTSLTPTASGQTIFTCQTDFLAADAGPQTFYAFVKAKLFGIPVPVPLEIGANAKATVNVQVPTQCPGVVNGIATGNLFVTTAAELACAASVTEVRGNLFVGDFGTTLGVVDLPLLTRINGHVSIRSLQSPGIVRLSNLLTTEGLNAGNGARGVVTLDLGSLTTLGYIDVRNDQDLTALSLPHLQLLDASLSGLGVVIMDNLRLQTITFGSGEVRARLFRIERNPALQSLRLGAVTIVPGFRLGIDDNPALGSLTTGVLTASRLAITRSGLTSLAGISGGDLEQFEFAITDPFGEAGALAFANRVGVRTQVCSNLRCYPGPPWHP